MTDAELREQFERCRQWNDPEQWLILADLYLQRGYELNAEYCREMAR